MYGVQDKAYVRQDLYPPDSSQAQHDKSDLVLHSDIFSLVTNGASLTQR
jgi:hypothetical protein